MKIARYGELSDKNKFFNFLKTESSEKEQPAKDNLWAENWESNTNTLPYILTNTNRFDGTNGDFFILFDDDQIVACGGVYISDFDPNISIAGVRTWIKKEYRHKTLNRDYLLTEYKKWSLDRNLKIIALTFNEYNKNIIQIFKRNRLGESKERIISRKPHHMFFNGLHEVQFPVTIKFTKQWVIYEKLDPNYEFDWTSLK